MRLTAFFDGVKVEIDLIEQDGRTTLKLVHKSVPPDVFADHLRGWIYFLARLQGSWEAGSDSS
jgi:hypothetical protein